MTEWLFLAFSDPEGTAEVPQRLIGLGIQNRNLTVPPRDLVSQGMQHSVWPIDLLKELAQAIGLEPSLV